MLQEIRELAETIQVNGKMTMLLTVLKKCFSRLSRLSAEKKAIVFTDNLITLRVLRELLKERGYDGMLTYSGRNSRDYSIMERFRRDKEIQILIATNEAAKGLDIEFCPSLSIMTYYTMLSKSSSVSPAVIDRGSQRMCW